MIEIVVYGTPAPQGSKRFLGLSKAGKGILAESSAKVKPWRQDVMAIAGQERPVPGPIDGPVRVCMVFTMKKPASAPKKRRTWPDRKPDLSKLVRSTEDALVDAGVLSDDARIVEFSRVAKVYTNEDPDALQFPGVLVRIWPIE